MLERKNSNKFWKELNRLRSLNYLQESTSYTVYLRTPVFMAALLAMVAMVKQCV
jgi:hypothetical protein